MVCLLRGLKSVHAALPLTETAQRPSGETLQLVPTRQHCRRQPMCAPQPFPALLQAAASLAPPTPLPKRRRAA